MKKNSFFFNKGNQNTILSRKKLSSLKKSNTTYLLKKLDPSNLFKRKNTFYRIKSKKIFLTEKKISEISKIEISSPNSTKKPFKIKFYKNLSKKKPKKSLLKNLTISKKNQNLHLKIKKIFSNKEIKIKSSLHKQLKILKNMTPKADFKTFSKIENLQRNEIFKQKYIKIKLTNIKKLAKEFISSIKQIRILYKKKLILNLPKLLRKLSYFISENCEKIKYLFFNKKNILNIEIKKLKILIYYMFFFPLQKIRNFEELINEKICLKNFDRNFYEKIKMLKRLIENEVNSIQEKKIGYFQSSSKTILKKIYNLTEELKKKNNSKKQNYKFFSKYKKTKENDECYEKKYLGVSTNLAYILNYNHNLTNYCQKLDTKFFENF